MFIDPVSIKALQNVLAEIETLISAAPTIPQNTSARCLELLQMARALTSDMMARGSRIQ